MTKRVAVYARYSSKLQKPTSIDDQFEMAERFAKAKGWTVTQHFSDSEISGRLGQRPGLLELREAIRRNAVDVVLVEAVDRLTRNVTHALQVFDLMSFANVELHSLAEGPQNFMSVMLTAWGAREYSNNVSIHTKRGMQAALKRGTFHMRPYGYRKSEGSGDHNREVDPEQAAIVCRIFQAFADGQSALAIARRLNAEGVPAPRGGTWEPRTIRGNIERQEGILHNPIYVGRVLMFRTTKRVHPETEACITEATPDRVEEIEIPALRIIPDDLWETVQARAAKTRRKVTTRNNPEGARRKKYLLSGLLKCGCCGRSFVMRSKEAYGCAENIKGACRNRSYIKREEIEARVFAALRAPLASKSLSKAFDAALKQEIQELRKNPPDAELTAKRAALARTEKGLRTLVRSLEEGAPFAQLKARMNELEAQQLKLTEEISRLSTGKPTAPLVESAPRALEQVLCGLEETLSDPNWVHLANEHLSALIERVTLLPNQKKEGHMDAEISIDLGDLLSAADQPKVLTDVFRGRQQITVKLGALPPLASAFTPGIFRAFGSKWRPLPNASNIPAGGARGDRWLRCREVSRAAQDG
ncbi:recombinase family protein [Thioclava atlantica]|uniref:Resolvase domain n=1 Tax=Thioclava atlantica TaxID=1317124 RepID=A0A085TS41_9RHOB|nr:recombinase family protein [Thioclava atlantica]KFE33538.1 Resolvase domain [Thioclava atlantica]